MLRRSRPRRGSPRWSRTPGCRWRPWTGTPWAATWVRCGPWRVRSSAPTALGGRHHGQGRRRRAHRLGRRAGAGPATQRQGRQRAGPVVRVAGRATCATSTRSATARTWPASSPAATVAAGAADRGDPTHFRASRPARGSSASRSPTPRRHRRVPGDRRDRLGGRHRRDAGLNIRVLNLSFGTDGAELPARPAGYAVEHAWRKGIVVVVSAGNEGSAGQADDPAYDPYVIAVGADDRRGTPTRTRRRVAPSPASATRAPSGSRRAGQLGLSPARPGLLHRPQLPRRRASATRPALPGQRHVAGRRGRVGRRGAAAPAAAEPHAGPGQGAAASGSANA